MRTAICRFVPRGVVLGASLDGPCPACGKPISEHDGVTVAIDTFDRVFVITTTEEAR